MNDEMELHNMIFLTEWKMQEIKKSDSLIHKTQQKISELSTLFWF